MDEIKIEGEKEINLERIKHKDWEFLWNDEKMMSSKEMDMISDRMKIHHLPEMLFGHNRFFMVNTNFDFVYEINPLQMLDLANYNERKEKLNSDGLNRIYYSPPDVKVQYYDKWKNMKIERDDIQKLDPVADWSFSSSYMGTVTRLSESKLIEKFDDFDFTKEYPKINIVPSTEKLPVDRLGVDNPILNYMQVNLYDDELCDNGISEGKFR